MLLDAEPDIEVVGEAADGVTAVAEARRLRPDIALMDVRMPCLDGIEATRSIANTLQVPIAASAAHLAGRLATARPHDYVERSPLKL